MKSPYNIYTISNICWWSICPTHEHIFLITSRMTGWKVRCNIMGEDGKIYKNKNTDEYIESSKFKSGESLKGFSYW